MTQPAPNAASSSWLTGLNLTIMDGSGGGGAASGGGAPAPSGPGFTMNRDEAHSLLTKAKRVRDNTQAMRPAAEQLTRLTPPAADPGSTGFNQQAVGSFTAGQQALDTTYQYMSDLVGRLEKALGIVGESDDQAAAGVKTVGNSDQGKGLAG
ncbi:hypothetical protein [Amycolatopsis sp. NBC_01480]|uniref:hypothetical protein n=1 Tax=Amycolatopsis sp. NBC_01480 TaxID=2903562 RepID=UPI002E2A2AE7|nr:hypothetical protein [Amycolatopsis sp. NBC_01480]